MKKRVLKCLLEKLEKPVVLEKPKDKKFGHYATPIAFSLAKELRKPPYLIAQELVEKLEDERIFESVVAVKGYINFKLSEDFLDEYATWALKNEDDFGKNYEKKGKILLEFVSANPTGPLHIGHARGALIGEALYKIGSCLGYDITKEYYVNDEGNQVYLLGLSVFLAGKSRILKEEVDWPKEHYKGEYIFDLAKELAEKFGKEIFYDDVFVPKIAKWSKEKVMEWIRDDLKKIGVVFDNYVSEEEIIKKWGDIYKKLLEAGALYEKDGKSWINSAKFGDEKDRVVLREDKRPTYLAGDIVYHYEKFKKNYSEYINIWGADHHGYIARIKAAIRFLGFESDKLKIILTQMVSLLKGGKPYKMSKRAGNFILLGDVVEDVGADALKFIFLSKKPDTHLEFDVEALKKEDTSNPIYYINYAHARISSLFRKAAKNIKDVTEVKLKGLNEEEKTLLFVSLLLPEVMEDVFLKRETQRLTDYLRVLASEFHKFYNKSKILGSKKEDIYLKLSAICALSIKTGLGLLGIKAKDKM
jgi:arginyl-tRNA synthetase